MKISYSGTPSGQKPYSPTLFLQAHQAYTQGQFARAAQELLPTIGHLQTPFEAENLCAVALVHAGQAAQAEAIFAKWLHRRPDDMGLALNLGWSQLQIPKYDAALATYQWVLRREPLHPVALEWAGLSASRLGLPEEAAQHWQKLLALRPQDAQLCYNLGTIFQEIGDLEQALAHYQQALQRDPQHFQAAANARYAAHFLGNCTADEILQQAQQLSARLSAGISPHRTWHSPCDSTRKSLRIAVISPDLHEHPVGYFLSGLLTHVDTAAVTWLAYSDYNPRALSPWAQALRARFAKVRNTTGLSDAEIAASVYDDRVDVLLDLTGWTRGQRLGVFAHHSAPVQLAWLGYFASTGLAAIDGIVADALSIPTDEEHLYTEKVWRMPHTRLCYDIYWDSKAWPVQPLPAKENGFLTFACFQFLGKVNQEVLRTWGDIARHAPTAHWYIQSHQLDHPLARRQLEERLAAVGISGSRLTLHGKMSFPDYMQAYQKVDVLLDTFPYPGGTTTLEALWAGVPTLTLATPGMLGRQGQALLGAAGIDEAWVCPDHASYIARAVAWAQAEKWQELAQLRASLRDRVQTSPAFDTVAFARDWLALIRTIWTDACNARPWISPPPH